MLVDVQLSSSEDPSLKVMVGGSCVVPRRLRTGIYVSLHWNFAMCFPSDGWKKYPDFGDEYDSIGVCDSIEQFEAHPLGKMLADDLDRKFVVSFVHISKKTEPKECGWRWSKWGQYIGNDTPECEYLSDESGFNAGVWTYHVYEAPREGV